MMSTFDFGTPISASAADMTLEEARAFLTNVVLQLPSTTVNNTRIDQALLMAGREFMEKCRPVHDTGTVNTVAETDLVTFTADGFTPQRLVRVTTTDPDDKTVVLSLPDLRTVLRHLRDKGDMGVPRMLAFREGSNEALMCPVPDDAYTLRFTWAAPFTTFTPGTANPGGVTLNIPLGMIGGVLSYGVPAYYHRGHEDRRLRQEARALFDTHIAQCRGQAVGRSSHFIQVNEDRY